MLLSNNEQKSLKEVLKRYEQIEDIYNSFSQNTKDIILDYHNYEGSLPYSIHWGLTAITELLAMATGKFMKTIYNNKIVEVNVIQINYEENCAKATTNDEEYVTLLIYTYYEFAEEPLLFMPLPEIQDIQKLAMIHKYEEWYGNTDQNTTDWELEFVVFVRNILINHLIINPKYLELDKYLLMEVLDIIKLERELPQSIDAAESMFPSCNGCDYHECFDVLPGCSEQSC